MKTWLLVAIALASALCTLLASAPIGSGFAAIAAPMFLILIALYAKSARRAFLIIFVFQIPLWLLLHAWVIDIAFFGWLGIGLYMALWAPLFVWLLRKVQSIPRISVVISAPVLWVGLECLRGIVIFDGYPWYLAGTGLVDWHIAKVATIGSVWLVSYLVVTLCATIAGIKIIHRWTVFAVVILSIGLFARQYGYYMLNRHRIVTNVLLIQTNVPQSNKVEGSWERQIEDVSGAIELTRRALQEVEEPPSLIVWPETMVPGTGFEVNRFDFAPWDESFTPLWFWAEKIRSLAKEIGIPILVGSQTWTGIEVVEDEKYLRVEPESQYNSAALVYPDGTSERYDKTFLTPFGERIPYLENSTTVKAWVRETFGAAMLFDLKKGGVPTRFSIPAVHRNGGAPSEIKVATPICFEDTVSSVIRNLVWEDGQRKASALINLSNDGWFGSDSSAHEQHVREARMRCIESMTPMLRVANTGISCSIDYSGGVRQKLPILESGYLFVRLTSAQQLPQSRYIGDSVAWICLFGSILLVLGSFMKRSKEHDENTS